MHNMELLIFYSINSVIFSEVTVYILNLEIFGFKNRYTNHNQKEHLKCSYHAKFERKQVKMFVSLATQMSVN